MRVDDPRERIAPGDAVHQRVGGKHGADVEERLAPPLIAMVPAELAELSRRVAPVRILQMALEPPVLMIKEYWHRRFHADPDGKSLRATIASLLGE